MMNDSPTGDIRRTMDSSMSPDSENRDSRCTGKKNENQYEKDILGDLGASPTNNMASGLSPCHVLPSGITSNSNLSQIACIESSSDCRGISSDIDKDGDVDLISVVPSSADGMNEYLMQHMRSLLNPLLVGSGDHTRASHVSMKRVPVNEEDNLETGVRSIGHLSSGGSSDDENDVLVWRLPPSAVEARLLHEAAPNPHDVSGDFIDIDMVTPSNQSMDGTSSMDEDPFVVMQNNLDGDDEDEDASDDDRNLERVGAEPTNGADIELNRANYAGGHLDPFIRHVEGQNRRSDDSDDQIESEEGSSNEMMGIEADESQPFNNLSLNLMGEERPALAPAQSDLVPTDSCNHNRSDISSRMNVTSSEEFSSPPQNSSCSSNPPPTPGMMPVSPKTMADVATSPLCDCAVFLWSEVMNSSSITASISPFIGDDEKVMLWSPQEVEEKRYFGLGDSSLSGPTALANVLSVFNLHHRISIRAIRAATPCTPGPATMVDEGVPLTHFLLNRCAAGCPASSLVSAVHQLTDGAIRGFFLPLRAAVAPSCIGGSCSARLPLCGRWSCIWRWLAWLVRAGVVPMVTLNCQQQGLTPIDWIVPPDWHHQMVYGVDAQGLYLTGPEEFLQGDMAMTQLVSENILLVRKSQILSLWKEEADLWELTRQPDPKWESMNVLGQVVGTLRQSGHKNFRGFQPEWAHHVAMPTPTHAGITLFVRTDPSTEISNYICQRLELLSDRLHARLLSL